MCAHWGLPLGGLLTCPRVYLLFWQRNRDAELGIEETEEAISDAEETEAPALVAEAEPEEESKPRVKRQQRRK